ncbi:MAG: hypothetical protein COW03_08340 [Cytophagales bacterium CG12_big_fil_rev_8_21_14_0_65_40_12]|nr:MAG: hypothetical protein COW03_08340 [Cytophagales bacterium CG12_big_fil_rev_8_21_14_0_65_40_12]PIW05322.1 MAG: hypothetical protein COW40_05280 [Cytophagales bacterium CG17_big_fil_post_rev_8_21_14_2_50_40_13]
MKRTNILFILFCLLMFSTCVEPYDFEYGEIDDVGIAIEGYLSDLQGVHQVRVSKTTKLGDSFGVEIDYVINARVSIVDDLGGIIPLSHTTFGVYKTDESAVAEDGRNYKVRVVLINGTTYESSFEVLPEKSPEISNISYEIATKELIVDNNTTQVEGLALNTSLRKGTQTHFYRWEVNQYLIIESDSGPNKTLEQEKTASDTALRYCFVKNNPFQELYLQRDFSDGSQTGTAYTKPLQFIPFSKDFEHQFAIESYMLEMDEKAFTFWEGIDNLSKSSGSLFDPAPYSVIGNIDRIGDAEPERALGYFGVYRATVDRKILTQTSLGISLVTNDCTVIPSQSPNPPPQPCQDCRLYNNFAENYQNRPPSWWQY